MAASLSSLFNVSTLRYPYRGSPAGALPGLRRHWPFPFSPFAFILLVPRFRRGQAGGLSSYGSA